MGKVIIHVGCHKTGTTWLQERFFQNIQGVQYLYKERDIEKIKEYAKHCSVLIISDEEISGSMPHRYGELKRLVEMKSVFPDAKIIIGTREHNSWLGSCYAQAIKAGSYMSKHDYMSKYFESHTTYWFKLACHILWKDVFSYDFGDFIYKKREVLSDMCEFIGVDVPDYSDIRMNKSITHLKLWRAINIIMRGEWLKEKIESPYWILTKPFRRLGLIWKESERK